jgi:hypothetical protein
MLGPAWFFLHFLENPTSPENETGTYPLVA